MITRLRRSSVKTREAIMTGGARKPFLYALIDAIPMPSAFHIVYNTVLYRNEDASAIGAILKRVK